MQQINKRIRDVLKQKYDHELINSLQDDDDFNISLGADSFQLVKIIIALEDEFECDMSEIFIYETKITIELLEKYIMDKESWR